MQIKTIMQYHYIPTGQESVSKNVEQLQLSDTVGDSVN